MYFVEQDTEKGKGRMALPNYFDTIFTILKSESTYSVLLNNIGSLLLELEDYENAEEYFLESIE
jgi:hypothetical protein